MCGGVNDTSFGRYVLPTAIVIGRTVPDGFLRRSSDLNETDAVTDTQTYSASWVSAPSAMMARFQIARKILENPTA